MDLESHNTNRGIARELAETGRALPGTLSLQSYSCGKANCRCRAEPPQLHGPYALWTRKVAGKTVTRRLSAQEFEDFQWLFDNAKRLRVLIKRSMNSLSKSLKVRRREGAHRYASGSTGYVGPSSDGIRAPGHAGD